jgi:hypothetical protein
MSIIKRVAKPLPKRVGEADPMLLRLDSAPIDDEPVTAEDLEAIARGRDELARGEFTIESARVDEGPPHKQRAAG